MGDQPDAPNKEAVGLDPPWVEGEGGGKKGKGRPKKAPESQTPQQPAPQPDEGAPKE